MALKLVRSYNPDPYAILYRMYVVLSSRENAVVCLLLANTTIIILGSRPVDALRRTALHCTALDWHLPVRCTIQLHAGPGRARPDASGAREERLRFFCLHHDQAAAGLDRVPVRRHLPQEAEGAQRHLSAAGEWSGEGLGFSGGGGDVVGG